MKPCRRAGFFSSSSTTVTYSYQNGPCLPQSEPQITEIPIDSPSGDAPVTVAVHLPTSLCHSAAAKIQSAYRSHVVRALVRKIAAADSEATRLERLIQRQETVDAIRGDDRERLRINESLMALLLRLDSVPGVDPAVRDLRRSVSRRIVGLQEIVDAICDARALDWYGFLSEWDWNVAEIEDRACRERGGGDELERYCAENLGFRCLQRFLRQP
ncbi:BAG family molecular chaperone regulator 5, mitochondrial [Malania oleifera]|uniref:BAG family molecular chaperone regulator 5, mitochondrial n=1 Tax=Malania oleifera TaxID=397392 RepID=UPI0025ADFAFB|nr:BAG family molecular chaperone regulator 5, mitochondrial [Malania oleifera]